MPIPPRPPKSNQYANNRHTYIPERVQKAMTRKMERALPSYMKKYAGAYVQQNLASQPGQNGPVGEPTGIPGLGSGPIRPNPASPPLQNHFQPAHPAGQMPGESISPQTGSPVTLDSPATAPESAIQAPAATNQPAPEPRPPEPGHEYDFITDPPEPAKQSLSLSMPALPGVSASLMRYIVVGLAVIVALILFTFVKGLLAGSSNINLFLGVAQDQQAIIHITTSALESQNNLSTDQQNFASTVQLSLTSSKLQTIQYMATNKIKIDPKNLNLKVSAATDTQLTEASAAGTYSSTFSDIMRTKLKGYLADINNVYKQTNGKKGHALLSDEYKQAQLLLTQLDSGSH